MIFSPWALPWIIRSLGHPPGPDNQNGALRPSICPQNLLESHCFLCSLRDKSLMTLNMNPLGSQNMLEPTAGSGAELALFSPVQMGKQAQGGVGAGQAARHPAPPGVLIPWCSLGPASWAAWLHALGLCAAWPRSESHSSACVSLLLPTHGECSGGEDQLVCPKGGRWLPRPNVGGVWV